MEHHFLKDLVINSRELKYKGIFRIDELFAATNTALEAREYEKREKKTEETVTDKGRKIYVELRPYKMKSSYVTLMIKIKFILDNITETVEEVKGQTKKFQQGDVLVIFDAWSLTDYEHRWEMKPLIYFLKGFIRKFLYKFPLEENFRAELVVDTAYIYAQIKKMLRSYRPETSKIVSDEEVRKKIEEEINQNFQ